MLCMRSLSLIEGCINIPQRLILILKLKIMNAIQSAVDQLAQALTDADRSNDVVIDVHTRDRIQYAMRLLMETDEYKETKTISKEEYIELLEAHDWYHMMKDFKYRVGMKDLDQENEKMLEEIGILNGWDELFNEKASERNRSINRNFFKQLK